MDNDFSSTVTREQRLLVQSLIDGSITKDEMERLNAMLLEDSLLRAFYIDQTRMDTHLRAHFTESNPLVFIEKPDARKSRIKAAVISLSSAGIAAALTVAGVFTFFPERIEDHDNTHYSSFTSGPSRTPLVRISGQEAVQWTTSTGELADGAWLPAGKVELSEGLLELTYDSGATVVLKAPSTYYIEESNSGFLENGSLRAHSPKTVDQFKIETPNTRMVDYGTTFGVTTSGIASTAIHVIEGLVKATAWSDRNEGWKELRAGDALAINSGIDAAPEYEFIQASPSQFAWAPARRELRKQNSLNYLHWSFDEFEDGQFAETGNAIDRPNYPAMVNELKPADGHPTHWQHRGVFGNALQLNGNTRFLNTEFPGISGNQARTVACWIRIPEQRNINQPLGAISTWGEAARGKLWKLALRNDDQGPGKHYLRTETGYGNTAAKPTLNDGKWHHVASVFTGGDDADAATHVLHYVDGRLVQRGSWMSRRVNTTTDPENHFPMLIGASVEVPGPHNLQSAKDVYLKHNGHVLKFFEGMIDELYVFDDALSPEEIVHLMETNRPPQ